MGWFRLFDRLRLRPASETLEGWALPGSALRVTDPHLASYFRGLIASAGVSTRADLFDIASHMFARSLPALHRPDGYAFHLDIRAMGAPAALMLGSDQVHAIAAFHAASRTAQVAIPGEGAVELRAVDLDKLLRLELPLLHIATLSAWLPEAGRLRSLLESLQPFLTNTSLALIRLPGLALPSLIALLPELAAQPVALLPCEPEIDDPANPVPDILLCLSGLSDRDTETVIAASRANTRLITAPIWSPGMVLPPESGVQISGIPESRAAMSGIPVILLGDAPPTPAGALLFDLQRNPLRGEAAGSLRFEMQAASVGAYQGAVVAVPLVGPAVSDPDFQPFPDGAEISLHRAGPMQRLESRLTLFLGQVVSRTQFIAQIWPKFELALELVDREKIPSHSIALLFEGEVPGWVADAVALSGFDPERISTSFDAVLFRRLILTSPTCDLTAMRRGDLFDRFWQRMLTLNAISTAASFTQPRSSGRVMLISRHSRLLNSAELSLLAQERQYRLIDPDVASPSEVSAALRNAAVIVAESQAGIWSALAPSAALGLLQSDTDPEIPYAALHAASARGHAVMAMFGSAIGNDPAASYVVASDRFALLLDRLEDAGMPGGGAP